MNIRYRKLFEISKKVPSINLMFKRHSPFFIFKKQTLIHKFEQNGINIL